MIESSCRSLRSASQPQIKRAFVVFSRDLKSMLAIYYFYFTRKTFERIVEPRWVEKLPNIHLLSRNKLFSR